MGFRTTPIYLYIYIYIMYTDYTLYRYMKIFSWSIYHSVYFFSNLFTGTPPAGPGPPPRHPPRPPTPWLPSAASAPPAAPRRPPSAAPRAARGPVEKPWKNHGKTMENGGWMVVECWLNGGWTLFLFMSIRMLNVNVSSILHGHEMRLSKVIFMAFWL